jgi:hypothetical protein
LRIEKTGGTRDVPNFHLANLTTMSTEDLIPADHPIRRIRGSSQHPVGGSAKGHGVDDDVLDPYGTGVQ